MKRIIILSFLGLIISPTFSQQVLTLEECKELTLKNNVQAKNAQLSVEIAKQQKREAFTKYFPSISGVGVGFMATQPMISMEIDVLEMMKSMMQPMMGQLAPLMGWLAQMGIQLDPSVLRRFVQPYTMEMLQNGMVSGVSAMQPIFAGGQIINGNRLAKAGIEVQQLQKQMTENEVLLTTERYFWQLVSLKEKLKTIDNADTMLSQILSDVQIAVAAGLTTRNDLLRVEIEQNKLSSGRLKLTNALQILKMVLARQIGIPADSFDIYQPEIEDIPIALHSDETATDYQNRLEYKLLEKSVDIAKLQVKMEIGKNLPTIAVGAGYNYMNFDLHKDDGMKNDFGVGFVTVTVPITDWWSGAHAIKRKKLELLQAENTKREHSEGLLLQSRTIRNDLDEAYQQILLTRKIISSARENLKISQDTYAAGITTLADLLEAQNLLQQSRDQYTEAATAYFTKLTEYKQMKK